MRNYAVWGNPIAQSKSPRIHQLFAEQTQKKIRYVAELGDEQQFESQIKQFFETGGVGANITAPFKERAFRLADSYSEVCLQAEACNTLMRLEDGRLYADNTDGVGLVADLCRLNWLKPLQRVLILGAGGATKGVLYPLLQAQQIVTVCNRTIEKADDLVKKFAKLGEIHTACFEQLADQSFDLIINATSLGLQGKYIELPKKLYMHSNMYDMQYASGMNTPFLNYARQQGAENYQDGLGMLVYQAAYAFQLWEGVMPEVDLVLHRLKAERS